jgi:hypothetical protein
MRVIFSVDLEWSELVEAAIDPALLGIFPASRFCGFLLRLGKQHTRDHLICLIVGHAHD